MAGTRRLLIVLGLVGAVALFLLVGLGSSPIHLWDESRSAVNAMEMHLRGLSLTTTYEFAPDDWNTKPPLLIWLTALLMDALGPSETTLRLPSAIAAIATVGIVAAFCWRMTRSVWWSLAAAAVLLGSTVFIGDHAAASGDYDALLTFFTTAYVALAFFLVRRRRPLMALLIVAAVCVAGAVLTKSAAGLIPGVGVMLYLVLVSRWRRILSLRYLAAALIAIAPVLAYYAAREHLDPGYLGVVNRNELLGRYATTIGDHARPIWGYLVELLPPRFIGGVLIILVPVGLWVARGRARAGLLYATVVAATIVAVFSLGATKLPWYIAPAMPWLAVSLTLAARSVVGRLQRSGRTARGIAATGVAGVVLLSVVAGVTYRHVLLPRSDPMEGSYAALLGGLHARGERIVRIWDDGVDNTEGLERYAPQLRFYALLWTERGMTVELIDDARGVRPGDVVGTCDDGLLIAVAAIPGAVPILHDAGCQAVSVAAPG